MGDMADYFNELQEEGGRYFLGSHRKSDGWSATCKHCGMTGLKWRAESEGWRLFENERVEHNRLKKHDCRNTPSAAEDFDDIS